jgi:glycosyltransferase involved in cell wall biosynthesis
MTRLTIDLRMYRHSGIGRYLRNLIPQLLPLLHADRIRVVAPRALIADAPWLTTPQVELFETSAPIYSLAEQLLPLRGAFRNTTLLWVPHYNAPLLYRGPLALTMHDIAPLALPAILSNPIKRAYARLLITRASAHASAILCDSAFTAADLRRLIGTPSVKMTVVHLGLDEAWPSSALPHREPDGIPYLLFVGNVKPNKNLTLLLNAFARVQDRLPLRLLIAGRMSGFGSNDEAVLRQAQSMPRVRFTGEISDADLIALYAGARALVLPSLYEGFGLPLLEAMQLGCPCLSSNATSLPEVGGDAALYFDPHDVDSLAARLLDVLDEPLMQRLRLAGRIRAAEFSYARCAAATAAILNPLLKPQA